MEKSIPFEKRSKKKQRELNAARRTTWTSDSRIQFACSGRIARARSGWGQGRTVPSGSRTLVMTSGACMAPSFAKAV